MPGSSRAQEPQRQPAHILLIEDDAVVRDMLERALERAGYLVLTAEHGRDALEGRGLDAVDLVISDVQMPEMNGIEVLQAVRERAPRLPVLMLSGAWPGLLKDAQLLGADAVLEKPVALHELLATVRSLLQDAAGTGGERS